MALYDAFLDADRRMRPVVEAADDYSGSTAVVAVVTRTHVVVANCGDSRAVVGTAAGSTVPLSWDHKPTHEAEKARISAAGGCVANGRVDGDLAVSRSLGDYQFKRHPDKPDVAQRVSPEPNVAVYSRGSGGRTRSSSGVAGDGSSGGTGSTGSSSNNSSTTTNANATNSAPPGEFLVLACDGVWDMLSSEECTAFVRARNNAAFRKNPTAEGLLPVLAQLLDHCLEAGSRDNMTAVVVLMPDQPEAAATAAPVSELGEPSDKDRWKQQPRAAAARGPI